MLFGSDKVMPGIVHSAEGERQKETWDDYVCDSDKPNLRVPHADTTFVLALLVSTVCHRSTNFASNERKYRAAALLRDFLNSALMGHAHGLGGLPVSSDIILPLGDEYRLTQAREFLLTLPEGQQLLNWWNALVARDVEIPFEVLVNPVTLPKFGY